MRRRINYQHLAEKLREKRSPHPNLDFLKKILSQADCGNKFRDTDCIHRDRTRQMQLFQKNKQDHTFHEFFEKFFIQEKEPSFLWYPASGYDFRDIMLFSQQRFQNFSFPYRPDLLIHVDYMALPYAYEGQILYHDKKTLIRVLKCCEIRYHKHLNFYEELVHFDVNRDYGRFYLMEVELESSTLGTMRQHLLTVKCEVNEFFARVILKNQLEIDYIVHVNDGRGFGGGRGGIEHSYLWMDYLKTKYLITQYIKSETPVTLQKEHCENGEITENIDFFYPGMTQGPEDRPEIILHPVADTFWDGVSEYRRIVIYQTETK